MRQRTNQKRVNKIRKLVEVMGDRTMSRDEVFETLQTVRGNGWLYTAELTKLGILVEQPKRNMKTQSTYRLNSDRAHVAAQLKALQGQAEAVEVEPVKQKFRIPAHTELMTHFYGRAA